MTFVFPVFQSVRSWETNKHTISGQVHGNAPMLQQSPKQGCLKGQCFGQPKDVLNSGPTEIWMWLRPSVPQDMVSLSIKAILDPKNLDPHLEMETRAFLYGTRAISPIVETCGNHIHPSPPVVKDFGPPWAPWGPHRAKA